MTAATDPASRRVPRIGWVGLGRMGLPMAGHLVKAGFELRVADLNAQAVASLLGAHPGAVAAALPELARASDIVVTMLPDGRVVREVAAGEGGLFEGARAGSLLVDMSSSAPHETVELERIGHEHGVQVIDAPVSGGVARARDGTLAIMAAGPDEAVERCETMFSHLGSRVFRCGRKVGSAHAVKALNNVLSCAGLLLAAEALAVGRRFGLDPEVMIDIFNASTGRNNATENKFHQFVFSGTHASGFALDLMVKDVQTAGELARQVGAETPLSDSCCELAAAALAELGAVDHTFLADWVDRSAAPVGDR
jgi:3-hydroxyisobutyrate dehydrogenase